MKITYYTDIQEIEINKDVSYLYFITEDINLEELRLLNNSTFFGAIVPHLIVKENLYESGILQVVFNNNELIDFYILDMKKASIPSFNDSSTLIILSDTLNEYFEPFIHTLNEKISTQKVFGSGVGSKQFIPIASLFDNRGCYETHSLIIEISLAIQIGVKHGWEAIYGPLVVTKSKNNIIYELNNEPALDVYRKILKDLDGLELKEDNFFDITKAYPLGILSYTQNEFIIRDPLQIIDEDAILMVSSIKENETVYIMKGEHSNLIEAASLNTKNIVSNNPNNVYLLFDCISRVLYMDKDFKKELKAVSSLVSEGTSLYGITSIGEFTNNGFSEIKIFNKTNLIGNISHVST